MLWAWDPESGRISYTNPAFDAFWGMSADSLADKPWQWLEHVDPADRERVLKLQLSPSKRTEEYKVTRPNGSNARLSQRALPMHSPSGKLLGVFVAYQGTQGAPARGDAALLQHAARLAALAIALRSGTAARV